LDQVSAPDGIFRLRATIGIDWIAHALLKTWRGINGRPDSAGHASALYLMSTSPI
jgi:hypothetical protein